MQHFEETQDSVMDKLPAHFGEICDVLDTYYPDPAIPLNFMDGYTLLIAVVLSAQCTDKRVNEVTPRLWEHGHQPADIVRLGEERIAEIIRPCGLYSRKASAIYEISKLIDEKFGGTIPDTREGLESLPSVGRKTANVILSHVFNVPAFPVDTHILRLSQRWGWSKKKTADGVEEDLRGLFPEHEWLKRHLQMIYFGRNYCKAKGHKSCPVCDGIL